MGVPPGTSHPDLPHGPVITFKYGWINNRTDRSINFNLGSIGAHLELSKSGKNKVGISYGGGIAYESAPVTIKS